MANRRQRKQIQKNEKAAKKEEKKDAKEWRTGKPRKRDPLKPFKDNNGRS